MLPPYALSLARAAGNADATERAHVSGRSEPLRGFEHARARILDATRLAANQHEVVDAEVLLGFPQPRQWISLINHAMVRNDFSSNLRTQSGAEHARIKAGHELRSSRSWPRLIVNFGQIDGVHRLDDAARHFHCLVEGFGSSSLWRNQLEEGNWKRRVGNLRLQVHDNSRPAIRAMGPAGTRLGSLPGRPTPVPTVGSAEASARSCPRWLASPLCNQFFNE